MFDFKYTQFITNKNCQTSMKKLNFLQSFILFPNSYKVAINMNGMQAAPGVRINPCLIQFMGRTNSPAHQATRRNTVHWLREKFLILSPE